MIKRYPKQTSFAWVMYIKKIPFWLLIVCFITFYSILNSIFAVVYLSSKTLHIDASILDYFYYSFITSFTIGYGDYFPLTASGKIIVIIHSMIMYLYSALTIAILSAKLFLHKEAIIFSNNLIYNESSNRFLFRMINTNREPLINPDIRISVTQHSIGNVIVGMATIPTDYQLVMLGKHDFSLEFRNKISDTVFDIYKESQAALFSNKKNKSQDSRFRITITITGSYGLQSIAICKKYYADQICTGSLFKAIEYNKEDERKTGEIRYTKFPNFWNDFNTII